MPNTDRMHVKASADPRRSRPRPVKSRPPGAPPAGRPPPRVNGSASQRQAQWMARAAEAERQGDRVEAELCWQYAEHWFRVARGED